MNSRILLTASSRWTAVALTLGLAGCVASPPRVDAPERIAAAVGTGEPIRFLTEGEPIDAGEPAIDRLTLERAVEKSLRHDAGVQAAIARVRVAIADADQARLLPNPVLSVAFRFPGSGSATVEAGLSEDLIAILQRPKRASAADHRLQAAAAEAVTTALDAVAAVQERYLAVQALEAQQGVLAERLRIVGRLSELAERRVQAGESGRVDVTTLSAQRAEIEADVIEQTAELRDQRLALAKLLGRPSSAADWKLPAWQATGALPGDERRWIAAGLKHRPEVQAHTWRLAALGDEAALARWAAWEGGDAGIDAEREDGDWSAGPALSTPLPIFDWGQAKRDRAGAQRIEARHQLTAAGRQVVEDVRRAWASHAAARAALAKVADEMIPAQQRRRQQTETAYKNGAADLTVVLLAEQDLQAGQSRLIDLQKSASLSRVRLERAVGGAGLGGISKPHKAATSGR